MAGELKTIYNNQLIRTSTADDTFTLNCNGKIMASDVTIQATDVDSLTVTYGGNTIATGSGTVTKILNCDGRVATSDIGVAVTMNSVPIEMPNKGDTINIDMDGDGTDERYLVLKTNGLVATVMSRTSAGNSTFGGNTIYANGALDTFFNATWYNTCSSIAKTAIVDKTFRQDSWHVNATTGSPVYQQYNTNYPISLQRTTYGVVITRHVYTLSMQDIIDYLEVTPQMTSANSTLSANNLWEMFGGVKSGFVWTTSASTTRNRSVCFNANFGLIATNTYSSTLRCHPVFQIDLSKISWSKQ